MSAKHGLLSWQASTVAPLTLCAIALDNVTIATNSRAPYLIALSIASVCAGAVEIIVALCLRRATNWLRAVMLLCGLACIAVLFDAAGRLPWCLGLM
ncbi:MAG TPA: hypothetical protein VHY91_00025 [Pirellulales bacterium]|jgi:hypothetical protein|nr:hypothetical protein [Pirellulales bacterium]